MKNKFISISSTTPIFATIIVYIVSIIFLLISLNSITTDLLSFVFMGMLGFLLLLVSMSLLYFKSLSEIIYSRLKLEAYVAMTEKTQVLLDYLVKQNYILKKESTRCTCNKRSDFKLSSFIIYFILGIFPGIIYLIVALEFGEHTISFDLGGKVYKDVTIDMQTNKLKYNE